MDDAATVTLMSYQYTKLLLKTLVRFARTRFFFAPLFSLLFCSTSFATPPVSLQQSPDYYVELVDHVEYLTDSTLDLDIDEVVHHHDFRPVTTPYVDFGLSKARVWLRARLVNSSNEAGTWRLDLRRQYNQETNIYVLRNGSNIEQLLSNTEKDSFSKRQIPSVFLATDVRLGARETIDIYVAYRSHSTTYLPLVIGKPTATNALYAQEHNLNLIMNGALLAMIIFALLMTPIISARLSISFAAYIVAGILYVMNADGYTFQYILPNHPSYNDPANLVSMLLMSFFGLSFSRVLFNFKQNSLRFDRLILTYILLVFIFILLALALFKVKELMIVAYSLVPLGSLLQVVAGIVAHRKGLIGAVPYLFGSLMVLSSMVYATVAHVVPGHFDLDHTLDYGHFALLCECIAFAAAMTLRLVGMRDERDRALSSQLSAAREQVRLSEALQHSQKEYIKSRQTSDLQRIQIESVSHDLQQPLASLRLALDHIQHGDEKAAQQMQGAFDYIESLATEQLTGSDDSINVPPNSNFERFPINAVLDNVVEMFSNEAEQKNLELRYRKNTQFIKSDPVKLMRAVSNLVANAINNTQVGGVLLACRTRKGKLCIEVWDAGVGMSEDQLSTLKQRGEKGTDSSGSGLGLSIVQEISNELDLEFEFLSRSSKGSMARLSMHLFD